MRSKTIVWMFGTAAIVLLGTATAATVTISRCVNDLQCLAQFQYAYIVTVNNALSNYAGDVFGCSGREANLAADYISFIDQSSANVVCRVLDKKNDGIVPKLASVVIPGSASTEKTAGEYTDEDFGTAFKKIDRSDVVIVKDKDTMTAQNASGSIRRFPIPEGKSFGDAMGDMIPTELCRITLSPWMPNAINEATQGEIAASIDVSNLESYEKKAIQQLKNSKLEGLDYAYEESSLIRSIATADCSPYANTSEEGGYFLYDSIEAPDRFYYIKRTSKAGSPNFYDWGTVRVLPKK